MTEMNIEDRLAQADEFSTLINNNLQELHEQLHEKQLELDLAVCDHIDRMPADLTEEEWELFALVATQANEKTMAEYTGELLELRHP